MLRSRARFCAATPSVRVLNCTTFATRFGESRLVAQGGGVSGGSGIVEEIEYLLIGVFVETFFVEVVHVWLVGWVGLM